MGGVEVRLKNASMVAFGETLTAEQVGDLVHLIRAKDEAPSFAPANSYVSAAEVATALTEHRRMVLLDARPVSDWRATHLPGALPAPFYDDVQALGRVPRDGTQIVVYCGCPHAAADRVANRLREMGHERVAVINEGLYFWRDNGYPLVSKPDGGGEAPAH
mgnify:FL=1